MCTTVIHNTARGSSDYLPSQPPDKHHSSEASDAVYWRGGGSFCSNNALYVFCKFNLQFIIFFQNLPLFYLLALFYPLIDAFCILVRLVIQLLALKCVQLSSLVLLIMGMFQITHQGQRTFRRFCPMADTFVFEIVLEG